MSTLTTGTGDFHGQLPHDADEISFLGSLQDASLPSETSHIAAVYPETRSGKRYSTVTSYVEYEAPPRDHALVSGKEEHRRARSSMAASRALGFQSPLFGFPEN